MYHFSVHFNLYILNLLFLNPLFLSLGVVGDWKNYFTDEQNERIEALCKDKFDGTGLEFDFE